MTYVPAPGGNKDNVKSNSIQQKNSEATYIDKYTLKETTVYPDGCVVNVMVPVLTDEEREKRKEALSEAAGRYVRKVFEQKEKAKK